MNQTPPVTNLRRKFDHLIQIANEIDEETAEWCDKMGPCSTDCPFYHQQYGHCIIVMIQEVAFYEANR